MTAEKRCEWEWKDNGARYEMACGNGADHYNEVEYFKYCPYCGEIIREVQDGT